MRVAAGPVVDVHNHVAPPAFVDFVRAHGDRLQTAIVREATGGESFVVNGKERRPLDDRATSCARRLEDMARDGVAIELISCYPFMAYYDVEPSLSRDVARLVNDGIAELVSQHPAAFRGIGTVPLGDVDASLAELERCTSDLAFVGVQVLTRVSGATLDDPRLRPFWAAAAQLRMPVLLHPFDSAMLGGERRHHLGNLLGNPFETTLSAALLIFSGLLDEHPDLQPVLLHGGGALPYVADRIDRGWEGSRRDELPPVGSGLSAPPTAYLRRFHYDCVTFSASALRYLSSVVGGDRVLLGTDYPTPMEMRNAPTFVAESGLECEVVEQVLALNAARLFRLGSARQHLVDQ
ncbi:MAG TPA: amidohydrolase family protein [Candidatus Saccharimonadales bacterium]|nr:amidohydrolase family protein [Candidatus Saccharimonadales bacterium]